MDINPKIFREYDIRGFVGQDLDDGVVEILGRATVATRGYFEDCTREAMANALADATGLTLPVALEELFWGDAGIGLAIFGSGLAPAGIAGNGTPEQGMEWGPQGYGTPDQPQLGAFCVSEPDAGSDVSSLRTRAVYDAATDEWVLNGTKIFCTSGLMAAEKSEGFVVVWATNNEAAISDAFHV